MGSSYLQSVIITRLVITLGGLLDLNKYEILSNEVGLQIDKNSWRAADIAICNKEKLKDIPLNNKYLQIAPEIVIEIDTKAHLEAIENPFGYYHDKTEQLLQFGVQKVFWIFTQNKKVMIAEKGADWITIDWTKDIEVFAGVAFNTAGIVEEGT